MNIYGKVTVLVIGPKDSSRWVELRGHVIGLNGKGVEAHTHKLTQQFFYRDIYLPEQKEKETRVIAMIQPLKVSMDAIFR